MSNKIVKVMDIPFQNSTKEAFIREKIIPKIKDEKKCFIVTANPEIVMEARRNNNYKNIILSADFVVPDGYGILLAAKWKGKQLKERIAGYDLMIDLLHYANEIKARCYFLGGKLEINEQTIEKVKELYPHIVIAGHHHGYFDIENTTITKQVRETAPDIIFVALGFPKQEQWIFENISQFNKGVFIGVGGSFDVISGNVKRAPDIWIKLRLEWLYRLIQQPFRWKRMLPIVKFVLISFFNRRK